MIKFDQWCIERFLVVSWVCRLQCNFSLALKHAHVTQLCGSNSQKLNYVGDQTESCAQETSAVLHMCVTNVQLWCPSQVCFCIMCRVVHKKLEHYSRCLVELGKVSIALFYRKKVFMQTKCTLFKYIYIDGSIFGCHLYLPSVYLLVIYQ